MVSKQDILSLLSDRPQPFAGSVRHLPRVLAPGLDIDAVCRRGAGAGNLADQTCRAFAPHAGQVSFPGGKPEAMDNSPADTALRETEEETGLSADMVAIKGYLPPVLTSTTIWSI